MRESGGVGLKIKNFKIVSKNRFLTGAKLGLNAMKRKLRSPLRR